MEISVKQRLVGAVVLVIAAVIFLPMIFDGPPPDDSATHSVPLALPASKQAVKVDIDSGQPVSPDAGSSPAPRAVEQPSTVPATSKPVPTPAAGGAKSTDTTAAKPAPDQATSKDATELGDSALASKPGWAVQAGSFADPEHARALAKRLKVKGLSAFVQRHEGGGRTLYRVRVGPFPERVDAERQAPAVAAAAGGPTKVVPTP